MYIDAAQKAQGVVMRPIKHLIVGLVTLAAAGSGYSSYAQTAVAGKMDPGLYLGASVGGARTDINVNLPAGVSFTSFSSDDSNFASKLYAGFPINSNLAIEVGYARLGRYGFSGTTTPAGTISQNFRILGVTAELVATVPVANNFSILGRIGGYYNGTDPTSDSSGAVTIVPATGSDREWNIKSGLGLQYDFARNLAVRLEAESYRKLGPAKLNLSVYSVGLLYRVD